MRRAPSVLRNRLYSFCSPGGPPMCQSPAARGTRRAGRRENLLVSTAAPGTESHDKLRLLSVIGTQSLRRPRSPPIVGHPGTA
ncbi:hypothetical protein ACWEQ2_12015 [Streptomyces sp. NPDC004096]|uniref:hypothetical protein n=1 Tax=unclassified Streptomyces TaxID=2593676 RepID=UPI0033B7E38D